MKELTLDDYAYLVEQAAVGQSNQLVEQIAREVREHGDSKLKRRVLDACAEDLGLVHV